MTLLDIFALYQVVRALQAEFKATVVGGIIELPQVWRIFGGRWVVSFRRTQ